MREVIGSSPISSTIFDQKPLASGRISLFSELFDAIDFLHFWFDHIFDHRQNSFGSAGTSGGLRSAGAIPVSGVRKGVRQVWSKDCIPKENQRLLW